MASTETELPCPVCRYDLRGLEDGACPECGSLFRTADLKPEVPGLAIERQSAAMQSFAQKATLPFRIMVAPRRAFQHECRPSRVLTATPWNVLIWTIVWFVVLVLVSIGGRYGLDRAMGMRLAVGSYWDDIRADRFGSLWSVPVHLTIAWAECAFVALLGMAISRNLPLARTG